MNIFKKLFGGQKTTEEVKQEKEKDFDMVKYDGVRALRMHQFDLAAKSLEHALQLNAATISRRLTSLWVICRKPMSSCRFSRKPRPTTWRCCCVWRMWRI